MYPDHTDLTDQDCIDVIKELDNGDIELKDWDVKFVGNCLDWEHFTGKQKYQIQRMIEEYKL